MILDIIDNNYFRNHKYSYIFNGFIFITLITYLLKLFKLIELNSPFDMIFEISYGLVLLIILLSYFIYTRIGKLEFTENTIISKEQNTITTIPLESIQSIKISSSNNNHYYLKFDTGFNVSVEMKNEQLNNLKRIFTNHQIEIVDTSFFNKLKKWFNKTNN